MKLSQDPSEWDRIAPHIDRALDLTPDERETWLSELGTSHPDIAEIVRAMLAERETLDQKGFLAQSPLDAATVSSRVGMQVGAYVIEREIGRGGMGEVWLAKRSDGRFEGVCAVKFLNAAFVAPTLADRFRREGQLLARLTHPNIARLLDAGTADGTPYLALEYIDGVRIDRYCDENRLSTEARVRLFLDVIAAVAHAHSRLIVHRDLKPSNVLVTAEGQVKLLDFGIAKLLSAGDATDNVAANDGQTRMDEILLTPEYAAPEQMLGESLSTATDVYQLGMLLYVLLAGRHPLKPGGTRSEKIRSALDGVVPHASNLADANVAAELRGDLDAILATALRKNPHERYATAQALKDELSRYLNREPVLARRGATWYRARMFVLRHRVGVAATSIAALALIGGAVATTWQAIEANRARVIAEANAREAQQRRTEAEFQAKLALANHELLSQIFGDAMSAGEDERMRARLDRAREMIRVRYANVPLIHGSLLMQLAGRYAELNDDKREQEIMEEFDRLVETSGDPNLRATSDCIRAYELIRGGQIDESTPYVTRGMAVAIASQDTNVGFECYRADAMLAASRGDGSYAINRMNEWLGLLETRGLSETRNYLASLSSLAFIHTQLKDPIQAYHATHRSRQLRERLGSGHTLQNYIDYEREAAMLIELGRFVEAAALDDELTRRLRSEGNAIPCIFDVQMATRFIAAARYEDAQPALSRCLPVMERDGPENYARGVALDLALLHAVAGNEAATRGALDRYARRLKNQPPTPREAAARAGVRLQLAITQKADRTEIARLSRELGTLLDPAKFSRRSLLPLMAMAAEGALRGGDQTAAREHANALRALGEAQRLDSKPSAWIGAAESVLARADLAAADKTSARQHLALAREHLADSVSATHPWRRTVEAIGSIE